MSWDADAVNALAGIAALVNSLILVPSIMALRKIASHHEERIVKLESRKTTARRRRRGLR